MMINGRNVVKVQQQEKLAKEKTRTARPKKDTQNAPEHDKVKKISPWNDVRGPLDRPQHAPEHDKVKKKKNSSGNDVCGPHDRPQNAPEQGKVKKKISPGDDVRGPLDRIRAPQKERNVPQQMNKLQHDQIPLQTAPPLQATKVTKREQFQLIQKTITRSPAQERMKKAEVNIVSLPQHSFSKMSRVPLQQPTAGNQATVRTTTSRAQALLVEMGEQSRMSIRGTQQHALPALATELHIFKQKLADVGKVLGREGEGKGSKKEEGVEKSHPYLQEDVVAGTVITEVSESTEPRFITPKEVSFDDCTPGSQKIDKPPGVDKNHSLRDEIEKQQELLMAQKEATRKEEMSGSNEPEEDRTGVDDMNNITVPLSIDSSPSIPNSTIRKDVEEAYITDGCDQSAPGAAWKNWGSDSVYSVRSFGQLEIMDQSRHRSRASRKTTAQIVHAISSGSARREVIRQELAERQRVDFVRKFKLLLSQNRAAARAQKEMSQCKCCRK